MSKYEINFESLVKLYGESSSGKIKEWHIAARGNRDGTATIITDAGYVGGKIKTTLKNVYKGKNIGRSNETTPFEQAASEALSQWNKQRDKNYEYDFDLFHADPKGKGWVVGAAYKPRLMLPQLAKGVKKGNINFPCYMQPKLNGICDLVELQREWPNCRRSVHHSRGGKEFTTLDHMRPWLDDMAGPIVLHGELYVHGWSLQKIGSYAKKVRPDQHKLQLWVYDVADTESSFGDRWASIVSAIGVLDKSCPIKTVPTVIVNNYEEAKHWHDKWVGEGFEGGVLKNFNGKYVFQFRSNDIEKAKDYKNAEFKIIGGKEGVGRAEGCVTYLCVTKDGKEFECCPRGTLEDRHQMYLNLENDIGKMLTVRFAEYSDNGVPLQPTGKPQAEAVRDYE